MFGKIRKWIMKIFGLKKNHSIYVEKPNAERDINSTVKGDIHTGDTHNYYHYQTAPPFTSTNNTKKTSVTSAIHYNPDYYKPDLYGTVQNFDYSDNNGKYVLGIDEMEFEIVLTNSDSSSIYIYDESKCIDKISISKSTISWDKIHEASDIFTGRDNSSARLQRAGEISVWKNKNGYYLLLKILEIKSKSHGDDDDDIKFQYCIGRKMDDGNFHPMIKFHPNELSGISAITPKIGMKIYWRNIKKRPKPGFQDVRGTSYPGHKFFQANQNYGITDAILNGDLVLCEGPE